MRIKQAQESWHAFAAGYTGGEIRARSLILEACTLLRQEKNGQDQRELYLRDPRLDELRLAIARARLIIGLDPEDAGSCIRWIMGVCFCVVAEAEHNR